MAGVITFSDIKFANYNATADGDNTIIAAIANKKIRVLGLAQFNATTAGLATWKSGSSTTIGITNMVLNTGYVESSDADGPLFETAIGQALVLNNGAGVDNSGWITYITLDASNAPA